MLTIRDVATEFNVSQRFVYRLIQARSLEAYRFGKAIRISKEALERYKEAQKMGTTQRAVEPPPRKSNLKFLKLRG
jgi:excisionase family DNA binding protein